MLSAETATFMKAGGLGMIASELPEAFNRRYNSENESMTVITPMYIGDTKKKRASFDGKNYTGAELKTIELKKERKIIVPFMSDKEKMVDYAVNVYTGVYDHTPYIFLENEHFFNIDPHKDNPPAQDGCYIMNKNNVNEVERFAFFSKTVYTLAKTYVEEKLAYIVHDEKQHGLNDCID